MNSLSRYHQGDKNFRRISIHLHFAWEPVMVTADSLIGSHCDERFNDFIDFNVYKAQTGSKKRSIDKTHCLNKIYSMC